MNKYSLGTLFIFLFIFSFHAQINLNGAIDSVDELVKKERYYFLMEDGTFLATDITIPMFRDSVTTELNLGGNTFTLQVIPKDIQFIVYDSVNITAESYRLPFIFSRTPYKITGETTASTLFPFLGFGFAFQDMRGRYASEGVYFPMFSDSWKKEDYMPEIPIPMDLTPTSDPKNALKHHDGSQSAFILANQLKRGYDYNQDGIMDSILYSNGSLGMYGASALGNSQYQLVSDIPFTQDSPMKCLLPIVGANDHYNSTLFHNGVFRNALVRGWITGQLDKLDDTQNDTDDDLNNTIHSSADYGYTDKLTLANDLIDWYVSNKYPSSFSGAHPTSKFRAILDASMAPINNQGISDANGAVSRYKNLNVPTYHLTGWWDIFINGQIETFNKMRKVNPSLRQKIVIGPWAHQTVGSNITGDVTYPESVFEVTNFDLNFDEEEILNNENFLNQVYESELISWYRLHLGGEPFFILPESHLLQDAGTSQIRIPSKDYVIPYYQFLNFLGAKSGLEGVPVEIFTNGTPLEITYTIPMLDEPLIHLSTPLTRVNTDRIDQTKDVRLYISGPTEDSQNENVGNYWLFTDSIPFKRGIQNEYFYFHQDKTLDNSAPTQNEGTLSYIADPNNPVITIGGNNMIPTLPNSGQKSQGSIDFSHPTYKPLTMDRDDVLQFISAPLADTMTVVGFPKAGIYAKGKTSTYNTDKTDFDVMVRILDVYPDGREMFITEGVVNAKSREYAKSISLADTNETIVLTNINNDEYYYFEFDLLPLGHTFGKGHQIKFLLNSSNYPKYQSNPHIPNEEGEFFRWNPGETQTYSYQGQTLSPQNAEITYQFNANTPSYVMLPRLTDEYYAGIKEEIKPEMVMNLYPNPAKQNVNITWNLSIDGHLEVYDMLGNLMVSKAISFNENHQIIPVEQFPKGIYLVRIPEVGMVKKLVVE